MKVGIVGSSSYWPDNEVAASIIRLAEQRPTDLTILVRSAEKGGVDEVATDHALIHNVPLEVVGPERVAGDADMLLAFFVDRSPAELRWKSRGTTEAVLNALHRGIPVHVHHQGHWMLPDELRVLGKPHAYEAPKRR